MLNIRAEIDQAARTLSAIEKDIIPRAVAKALNRSAVSARTQSVRTIAKDLGITQKAVRKYTKLTRAQRNQWEADVQAYGNRLPIHKLNARQTKRGVTYTGQGRQRHLIPSAFLLPQKASEKYGAFMRVGKSRYPLMFLRAVSIPYVFIQEIVQRAMQESVEEMLPKTLRHEIKWRSRR